MTDQVGFSVACGFFVALLDVGFCVGVPASQDHPLAGGDVRVHQFLVMGRHHL